MESGIGDLINQILPLILGVCAWGIVAVGFAFGGIYFLRKRRAEKDVDASGQIESVTQVETQAERESVFAAMRNFFFYDEEKSKPKSKSVQSEMPAVVAEHPELASRQNYTPQPESPSNAPPDAVEVMRVWRDIVDGSLLIEFGGTHYRTMNDIIAAGQERRYVALLKELARMTKERGSGDSEPLPDEAAFPPAQAPTPSPASAPPQEPQPAAPSTPTPAPQSPPRPQRSAPVPQDSDPSTPTMRPAPPPPLEELSTPVSAPASSEQSADDRSDDSEPIGTFFDNVRKVVRRDKLDQPLDDTPPLSVPEQIEEVLQRKLMGSPQFAGRNIHVRAGTRGVMIQVDDKYYEGVGNIAEDDVRAFVQSAVAEWDENQ